MLLVALPVKNSRYLGFVKDDGISVEFGAQDVQIRDKTKIAFSWTAKGSCIDETAVVHTCWYDFRTGRRVPLPPRWRSMLCASALPQVATGTAALAEKRLAGRDARCMVLGLPKRVPEPQQQGVIHAPRATVTLGQNGVPRAFILCAPIDGTRWFCHSGAKEGVEGRPFDPKDLVIKDVSKHAWGGYLGRDLLRSESASAHALQRAARDCEDSFALAVAVATFRAEILRSAMECRSLDWASAAAAFEANPWRWEVDKVTSKAEVCFMWSIKPQANGPADAAAWQYEHKLAAMNNVFRKP